MASTTKLTQDQLVALIDTYASSSYGGDHGQLAEERAEAIARYNGEPFGDERDGRSHAVSTELRDTVETVVPQLTRIFLGGDQICEFDPETPDDVAQSKQESRYVNFVVTQRNQAFQVFGTWFRDALLCKNGYVKACWEDRTDVSVEEYRGLSDDSLNLILQDVNAGLVEVVEHTEYPGPQGLAHDLKLRRKKGTAFVRIDNIPGEEILVHSSVRGPYLQDALYVEHRTNKTLSEIRQMGYDVPDDWAGTFEEVEHLEGQARDRFYLESLLSQDGSDPATRLATFREVWMRVDEDGDGIAELRRICLINRRIVSDEETDLIPIACITPVIQPHRHVGYGYYDFLKEIEKATTAMLRSLFDNIYLANNGRYGVNVDNVNVDDMLISRPGGIVRVKGSPMENIFPITHPTIGDAAMRGMEYLASWKKAATGVVMDSGAISSDVLSKAPASSISQVISVWQARVEGVARCFAETGMTELFRIVHALTLKNATHGEKVQLGGQWVLVDPREWVKRTSITVTVGLGTGSKESKIAFLSQIAQAQKEGLQIGIAKPQNLYETAIELMKEGGYKDGARFWTDPSQTPPQPPQKDPIVQAEEVKGQVQMALADKKAQNDSVLAQQDAQLKLRVEKYKAELEARTKLAIARIEIAAKREVELYRIQNTPVMTDGKFPAQ